MCGIAGIFNRDRSPVRPEVLVKMTRTLLHRGPDEEGYYIKEDGEFKKVTAGAFDVYRYNYCQDCLTEHFDGCC